MTYLDDFVRVLRDYMARTEKLEKEAKELRQLLKNLMENLP